MAGFRGDFIEERTATFQGELSDHLSAEQGREYGDKNDKERGR
jgi:hypothetical protein